MMILINGGSSSGKSAFAETLIEEQEKKEEVMAESTGKSMRGGTGKRICAISRPVTLQP